MLVGTPVQLEQDVFHKGETGLPRYFRGIGSRTCRGCRNLQMLKSRGQPSVSVGSTSAGTEG